MLALPPCTPHCGSSVADPTPNKPDCSVKMKKVIPIARPTRLQHQGADVVAHPWPNVVATTPRPRRPKLLEGIITTNTWTRSQTPTILQRLPKMSVGTLHTWVRPGPLLIRNMSREAFLAVRTRPRSHDTPTQDEPATPPVPRQAPRSPLGALLEAFTAKQARSGSRMCSHGWCTQ